MRFYKTSLLSSAACLAVVGAAAAADLPSRKAEPASYVKICEASGAGFFYIPGSDTCLRIGGLVRGEYGYGSPGKIFTVPTFKITSGTNAGVQALAVPGNTLLVPPGILDQTGFTTRALVTFDGRTQSSYGEVRTYIGVRAQTGTGIQSGGDNYATNLFTGQTGATALTLEQAIVQFQGFTFGRSTREEFGFMPGVALGSFSQSSYAGATNVLNYTAQLGNGLTAMIGIKDRAGQSFSNIPGYTAFGPGGTVAPAGSFNTTPSTGNQTGLAIVNGPMTLPVIGGNIRYEQGWGAVQAMLDVQQNAATPNLAALTAGGSPSFKLTKTGFAAGLGVKVNLPMLAQGDVVYATVAYADGDLSQLQSFGPSAVTSGFAREVPGLMRIDRDLDVTPAANLAGCAAATLTSNCFRVESTTGWSAVLYYNHFWTPTLRQWLFVSYWSVTPGSQTRNTDWLLGGLSPAQLFRIGTQTVWSPVKDFDLSGEVDYVRMNQKFAATSVANGGTGIASCQPGGPGFGGAACNSLGALKASGSTVELRARAERRF